MNSNSWHERWANFSRNKIISQHFVILNFVQLSLSCLIKSCTMTHFFSLIFLILYLLTRSDSALNWHLIVKYNITKIGYVYGTHKKVYIAIIRYCCRWILGFLNRTNEVYWQVILIVLPEAMTGAGAQKLGGFFLSSTKQTDQNQYRNLCFAQACIESDGESFGCKLKSFKKRFNR